jgi:hypothetical protein
MMMIMIGVSISQFCSLNGCPFCKLHRSIHVPPPSASMIKYVYALLCGIFSIWWSRECTHVLVLEGFVYQHMCMEFLCHCSTIFVVTYKLDALTSFSCLYVYGYQNGKNISSHIPWLIGWILYRLTGLLWNILFFLSKLQCNVVIGILNLQIKKLLHVWDCVYKF